MTDIESTDAYVAICQVKARYCHYLDTKDWDNFSQLFTEDFIHNVPGLDTIHGRDNSMAIIKSALADARTAHQIHIPEMDINGDEAQVIWPMQDRNSWDPPRNGTATQRGFGQYHERYIRIDGNWKIAEQKLVYFHLDFNFLQD